MVPTTEALANAQRNAKKSSPTYGSPAGLIGLRRRKPALGDEGREDAHRCPPFPSAARRAAPAALLLLLRHCQEPSGRLVRPVARYRARRAGPIARGLIVVMPVCRFNLAAATQGYPEALPVVIHQVPRSMEFPEVRGLRGKAGAAHRPGRVAILYTTTSPPEKYGLYPEQAEK